MKCGCSLTSCPGLHSVWMQFNVMPRTQFIGGCVMILNTVFSILYAVCYFKFIGGCVMNLNTVYYFKFIGGCVVNLNTVCFTDIDWRMVFTCSWASANQSSSRTRYSTSRWYCQSTNGEFISCSQITMLNCFLLGNENLVLSIEHGFMGYNGFEIQVPKFHTCHVVSWWHAVACYL